MSDDKDDIIARLTLDNEDFRKGLRDAVAASKKAGGEIQNGLALDETKLKKATESLSKGVKGVKKDLADAAKQAEEAQKALEKKIATITQAATAAAVAIGGLSIAAGNSALASAAKLDDLSQQTKVSAERIQILRYAFQANGVEIAQTDAALAQFSTRLGTAATGNKGMAGVFTALGVSIRDARGELRPTTDVLNDTITALSGVKNQSERQALAAQLFGKQAGPAMAKLLGEGIDGIKKYEDELRNMGGVMSDEMVKKAADADSQMKSLKTTLKASFDVGVLESYTDAFGNFTQMAKDPALAQAFHNLGVLVGDIASGLLNAVTLLGDLYMKARDALGLLSEASHEQPLQERSEMLLQQIEAMKKMAPYAKDQEAHERKLNMLIRERQGIISAMGYSKSTVTSTATSETVLNMPLLVPPVNDANTATGKLNRSIKDTAKSAETLGDSFEEAFSGLFKDISRGSSELRSFGDLARNVLQSIVSSDGFKNSVLAPLSEAAGSFFGSLFGGSGAARSGGSRSGGGPVNPGMSYLVGDGGPERLFMGRNSGYVVAANQRGGGGQVNNTYIYNNAGAQVSAQERTNTSGGRDLMVTIDEMVSNVLADPSSRSSRALRKSSGLRPSLTTR